MYSVCMVWCIWVCLKIVYPYTHWLVIMIPIINGYFIGGIPHFQTNPNVFHECWMSIESYTLLPLKNSTHAVASLPGSPVFPRFQHAFQDAAEFHGYRYRSGMYIIIFLMFLDPFTVTTSRSSSHVITMVYGTYNYS